MAVGKAVKEIIERELAQRAKAGDGLAMDYASRMARAKEMYPASGYHGTTHDFPAFGMGTHNPEGHFGAGHYITSSADDASRHYAGRGPDLTNRIDRRAEQIASENDWSYDDPRAIHAAVSELQGHEGAAIPTRMDLGRSYQLTDDADTFLSYERDVPDWEDYLDEAGGDEDLAMDMAQEASWDVEPTGELVDFMDSIRNQADELGFDASPVLQQLDEAGMDGGLRASEIDEIMRNTEWFAESPETGDLINSEVYRQAVEDAGFNSIQHKADIFTGMDVDPDTVHTIMFNPSDIRSEFAAFDPAKRSSSNLLASAAPAAIGLGALYTPEQNAAMAGQLVGLGLEDYGSITPDEAPMAESVANFIDQYIRTPIPLFEEPLSGVSTYLRGLGEPASEGERLLKAYGAALDVMP